MTAGASNTQATAEARLRQAAASRRAGDIEGAAVILAGLARSLPEHPAILLEWGLTRAAMGDEQAAQKLLQRAARLSPSAATWRALGDLLIVTGDAPAAGHAYAQALPAAVTAPHLAPHAAAIAAGRAAAAEPALKLVVQQTPGDAAAVWLLAEAAMRAGRARQAEAVLLHCLEIAPHAAEAAHSLAILRIMQGNWAAAAPLLSALVTAAPDNTSLRTLLAASHARSGDFAAALPHYEALLAGYAAQPRIWLLYAHALKTVGRAADSIAAYRKCLELAPAAAEAFLSLADVKTAHFTAAEIAAMQALLADRRIPPDDKSRLHYAIGRAFEQSADAQSAFAHFATGARLRRKSIRYDAEAAGAAMARAETLLTPAFFADRAGFGCPSTAPIFVLGLPRSGSTLVEQILASHSAVEGTSELPEIGRIANDLAHAKGEAAPPYPEILALMESAAFARLGQRYLDYAQSHRRLGRAHFIDKMPANFLHIGLIHLMLPHAKIIDVRRAPMAAGFAMFKQYFETDHPYSYDLAEIGRYYRGYVSLMAHFDAALPGRIHRVDYETLVADTEAQVHAILAYCGLKPEPACLRFWETERIIQTPSAQQVRQPIYNDAVEEWRRYEAWLGPLKEAVLF